MNNWDTMQTKRELFDLFENARILYNEYYRIQRDFCKDDLKAIKKFMELVDNNSKNIKEMINYELDD